MLSDVHVMGLYWREESAQPSPLGELVRSAKDHQDPDALVELQRRLVEFVDELDLGDDPLVLAVPPSPDRHAHPVPSLAAAVAAHLGVAPSKAVQRFGETTPRLRDTPLEDRRQVVEAAGYSVTGEVTGRPVVLIDDVILTGTTLGYLAEILVAAGAGEVNAVVVCRTRLAPAPRTEG